MANSLKSQTLNGVIWSSLERFSVQGVQFLVMLVIARILSPKDYGLIGMLAIFLGIAQSLIDSGFSQALIRKKDRTETDNSTVFYFNIFVSIFLYIILYLSSPFIANFYNEPELCHVMRTVSIVIVINGFAVVQRAIYTIEINFKTQARASFMAALISGGIGVALAYNGYGVWTLVYQQLLNAAINTILLWLYSNWRPRLLYSWYSFKEMFSFGSKLMLSGLLNTIYTNSYQLVIGKIFSADSLGYYSRANQFAQFPSSNITGILQRVIYPVLCKIQDDKDRYKAVTKQFLCLSAYIVFPLMCLLAGISRPMVLLVLGEKWEYTYMLLIPLCFSFMWIPIHAINLNVITVIGRSDLFLRLEIIKKVIGILILVITIPFGLLYMCYGSIIGSLLGLMVNTYYTGREIKYGLIRQMKDLAHILVLSIFVFFVILAINSFVANYYMQIALDIVLFTCLYFGISYLFRFKELGILCKLLKEK